MWNPSSPVTGQPQTGFTSPTYTFVADNAPTPQGKQVAVSALGGTQTGVTTHTISSPFTSNFVRPSAYKVLGQPNPVTGRYPSIPRNSFVLITRKGVTPAANQPAVPMVIRTTIELPAGADSFDPANIRAALSFHAGALVQQSSGLGDTLVTGIV